MNLRIIPAPLAIAFGRADDQARSGYDTDFALAAQAHTDPVKEWISLQEARGLAEESDKIVLALLAEMYKKIERLESLLEGRHHTDTITFPHNALLEGIGYDAIRFDHEILIPEHRYYGRIDLPIFPKRSLPLFFDSIDATTARIVAMHESDRNGWDSYIIARERAQLSAAKGLA